MNQNPQMIFERARRLYAEKIPTLIERERAKGDGWDDASGHLSTLYLIEAITEDEYCSAMTDLSAAMLEHLRSKTPAIEEPSPTKSPLRTAAQEECAQAPEPDTVLLVGPCGIGKTRHANDLAVALGVKRVIDPWNTFSRIPANTLAITNVQLGNSASAAQHVIHVETEADLLELIRDLYATSTNTAPTTSA